MLAVSTLNTDSNLPTLDVFFSLNPSHTSDLLLRSFPLPEARIPEVTTAKSVIDSYALSEADLLCTRSWELVFLASSNQLAVLPWCLTGASLTHDSSSRCSSQSKHVFSQASPRPAVSESLCSSMGSLHFIPQFLTPLCSWADRTAYRPRRFDGQWSVFRSPLQTDRKPCCISGASRMLALVSVTRLILGIDCVLFT